MRDLCNHGDRVLDRVVAREPVTITRNGKLVARLQPVAGGRLTSHVLVERLQWLPAVDPQRLRAEIDAVVDQRL